MSTNYPTPQNVATQAAQLGFTIEVKNHGEAHGKPRTDSWVITVEKAFQPGDTGAYITAESDAQYLLQGAPATYPGTTWGTDSASVGGHAGLTGGYMRLSKSGVSARFAKSLRKLLST